jgi:5-methylcytosine-specific restriction endonuclease McrA
MGNIINKLIVLKLNKAWQPVGYSTVGRAIVDLAGGLSARALDIDYEKNEAGEYVLDEYGAPVGNPTIMNPVNWDVWLTLPVRPFDEVVHYGSDENGNRKQMRVPTVLIAKNFNKMPMKTFRGKPSKEAIWIRDNGTDQYTGKRLRREDATIDHVLPQSKGGRDTWENLVTTHKKVNSEKGNRLNHEVGLTLIKKPTAPHPVPLSATIRDVKHPTWKPFLANIDD